MKTLITFSSTAEQEDAFPNANTAHLQSESGDDFIRQCGNFIKQASEAGKFDTYVDVCCGARACWAGSLYWKWFFCLRFSPSERLLMALEFLKGKGFKTEIYTYMFRGELECAAIKISWE